MNRNDLLFFGVMAAFLIAFFGNVKGTNLTYGECQTYNDSNGTASEFCAPALSNFLIQFHPADFGIPALLNYTCFSGEIVNNSLPFYQNVTVQNNVTIVNQTACNQTDFSQVWFSSRPIEVNATVQVNLTNYFSPNLTIQPPQINITVSGCDLPNLTAAPLATPTPQPVQTQGSDLPIQILFIVVLGGAIFIYWEWRKKNNEKQGMGQ